MGNFKSFTLRAVADPDALQYINNGQALCKFRVAENRKLSSENRKKAEAAGKPTADFYTITAFGIVAEYVSWAVKKGETVCVEGSLQTNSYTNKEGQKVNTFEIVADEVAVPSAPISAFFKQRNAGGQQGAPAPAPQGYAQQQPQGAPAPQGYAQQQPQAPVQQAAPQQYADPGFAQAPAQQPPQAAPQQQGGYDWRDSIY